MRLVWLAALVLAGCAALPQTTEAPLFSEASLPGTFQDVETAVGKVLKEGRFVGSAVLVHPRAVLTAAHVGKSAPTHVQLGRLAVGVDQIRIHPLYKDREVNHDLAVLILDRPVPFRPVPLFHGYLHAGDSGRALSTIGWGKLDGRAACRTLHGRYLGTLEGTNLIVWLEPRTQNMFGDSGGALLMWCFHHRQEELAGVLTVLWGTPRYPSASGAIRVDRYLRWIHDSLPRRLP